MAEAFARALAHWDEVGTHPNPVGWVIRTALNRFVSSWRIWRREAAEPAEVVAVPDESRSLDPFLLRQLWRLPKRQREVVALRVLADLDGRQTAEALGMAEGTVGVHLSRALGKPAAGAARHRLRGGIPVTDQLPPDDRELADRIKRAMAHYQFQGGGHRPSAGEARPSSDRESARSRRRGRIGDACRHRRARWSAAHGRGRDATRARRQASCRSPTPKRPQPALRLLPATSWPSGWRRANRGPRSLPSSAACRS